VAALSPRSSGDESFRPYSPMVETYIQNLRGDKDLGAVPAGDRYSWPRDLARVRTRTIGQMELPGAASKKKLFGASVTCFPLSMNSCHADSAEIYLDTKRI